jgi:hypothetical protein
MFNRFAAVSISSIALLRSLRNLNDIKRSLRSRHEQHHPSLRGSCEAIQTSGLWLILLFIRFAALLSCNRFAALATDINRSLRSRNEQHLVQILSL